MGLGVEAPYLMVTAIVFLVVYDYAAFSKLFRYDSSPIDWCEKNYVHSEYIAEFFNTISSFAMVICAVYGRHIYNRERFRDYEPKMWILWVLFAFIGVGSVLFHGTLSVAGQILDELPIVLMVVTSLVLLIPKKKWRPAYRNTLLNQRPLVILTFFLVLIIGCLRFPIISHIVTISMIPVVLFVFLRELKDFRRRSLATTRAKTKEAWSNAIRMFGMAFFLFCIAEGSWLVDRLYCDEVTSLFINNLGFSLELHAWWHVFSTLTFWCLLTAGIIVRTSGDDTDTVISYEGLLPTVDLA